MMRAIIGRPGYYWDPRWGPYQDEVGAEVVFNPIPNQFAEEGPIYLLPRCRLPKRVRQRWNVSALEHARRWTAKSVHPQVRIVWFTGEQSTYVMLRGEPTPGR